MKTDEMNEEITDLSALVGVDGDENGAQVYEVGYHILPTLSEEEALKEAAAITAGLNTLNAELIGHRAPSQINLAYPKDKKVEGKRQTFSASYFGWVAFSVVPSALEALKEALDANESILRHIITKTSRDQVATVLADPSLDVGAPEPEVEDAVEADTDTDDEEKEVEEETEEKD